MPRNQSPNLIAGGTINPSVFVMLSTTADNTVLQATANARVIGISQVGTKYPQGVIGATGEAAASGDNIEIFGLGDVCDLTAGTGGFTAGDVLVSDANGKGITATTFGVEQNVGAIALETTTAGLMGRVQVVFINSQALVDALGDVTLTALQGAATSAGGIASLVAGAGGATSGTGGVAKIVGGAGTAGNATGGAAQVTGGAGQGTAAGGAAQVAGGASGGGATGNGGVASVTGGAATSTAGNGGAAQLIGGVATTTGTGGAITITSGASAGASGTAGTVTIDAGAATGGTAGQINLAPTNALITTVGNTTNPALKVSSATSGTGVNLTSAAAGSGVTLAVISSGAAEKMILQAKTSGNTVTLNDTLAAATSPQMQMAATDTTTGAVTDGFTGGIEMFPTVAGANTVTRHNYINVRQPAGAATITDACVMRFDQNAGTHKAVDAGTTKTSPGTVTQWIKVNVNGTVAYIPSYSSKTS